MLIVLLVAFLFVVLLAALIVGVVWLARRPAAGTVPGGADRALDVLRERYARGEISREEFERMREDLKS